jgi:hypothetical protein
MAFKQIITTALVSTAFLTVPTAVNATYGAHPSVTTISNDARAARKAYHAQRMVTEDQMDARAQQTRKALMAMVVAVQASCDGACVLAP